MNYRPIPLQRIVTLFKEMISTLQVLPP